MEIVVVLVIVGILTGILTPAMVKYVQNSKLRRATQDVTMISAAIGNFYNDLGEWPIWVDGRFWLLGHDTTKINFLRTFRNGQTLPNDPNFYLSQPGWLSGSLEDHLILNNRGYPTSGEMAWRGPYIDPLRKDPWGVDYLVDVNGLWPEYETGATTAFVISTGPNRTIETPLGQQSLVLTAGGDDVVFRLK